MKRHWLLILLLCFPNLLYADEFLNNFLRGLRTLHGQFEQNLYNEQNSLLETSRGKIYMQRPNKFRWEYQEPYEQWIVADGERVWIYDKDLEQITMKSLDKALGKTPAFLLSRKRKIEEDFFVNKLPSQKGKTRFELLPKDAEASFKRMRINLRGRTLLGFDLVDNLGQTTYITFSHLRRNRRLDEGLFRNRRLDEGLFIFTPPAGVDILKEN